MTSTDKSTDNKTDQVVTEATRTATTPLTMTDNATMRVQLAVDPGDSPYAFSHGRETIAVNISGVGALVTLLIPRASVPRYAAKLSTALVNAWQVAERSADPPNS
jgi:hypothetical protein